MNNLVLLDGNKISGGINYITPECYSTEEREIGCWEDGKPLYQKTVVIQSYSPSSALQSFAHNVSNLEKGWVVEAIKLRNSNTSSGADDFSKNVIGNDVFSLTDAGNKVRSQVWGVDNTYIKVRSATDYTTNIGYDCYVTIRYTKTTDTAGSGSWTPQGVPTHHYSTEEHVVGTWIDGNTIYEKTWTWETQWVLAKSSNWQVTDIPNTNIGFILDLQVLDKNGTWFGCISVGRGSQYVQLLNSRSDTVGVKYMTLRYTRPTS